MLIEPLIKQNCIQDVLAHVAKSMQCLIVKSAKMADLAAKLNDATCPAEHKSQASRPDQLHDISKVLGVQSACP